MSYCDDCILADICGCESCYDESLTFCADKHKYISKSELKDIKADVINIADGRQSIKVRSVLNIIDRRTGGGKQ